jgi:F-type H+-transporting ATPase subunit b
MRVPILRLGAMRLGAATLLLAASLFSVSRTPAFAQTSVPASPSAQHQANASQEQSSSEFMDSRTANSQNLAKAEQEDEEYAFKHSDSVRAFAKMLHLSPEAASMVFWSLNAVLLFVFVGYFLVTGLPKAFRSRRQQLDRQIVEARVATEKAEERLRAVEERLSRLDSEIASVREQAERDSAHDETRIKQAMEDEKKKIVASAEQEIASAGAAAERRLRKFAAELAVDRATSRLHLTEGDDRTLIQEFASSLGSNGSEGGRN